MRVRSGLVTAIYKKALVLSNDGRSSASGDIVNLMSVDAARLQDFCTYGLIAISGPFQVSIPQPFLTPRWGWKLMTSIDYSCIHFALPPCALLACALCSPSPRPFSTPSSTSLPLCTGRASHRPRCEKERRASACRRRRARPCADNVDVCCPRRHVQERSPKMR